MAIAARRLCVALLPILLAFGAPAADAALVEQDWQTPGDRLLTLDTGTGLQWLDVSVTQGLSWNDATAQLAPGGRLAGFRRPTDAEIVAFWRNAGIPTIALDASIYGAVSEANFDPIRALQQLWGTTPWLPGATPVVTATLVTGAESYDPVDRMVEGVGLLRLHEGQAAVELRTSLGLPPGDQPLGAAQVRVLLGVPPGEAVPYAAHALVQAIPEPSTVALLTVCMVFALGAISRRRLTRAR